MEHQGNPHSVTHGGLRKGRGEPGHGPGPDRSRTEPNNPRTVQRTNRGLGKLFHNCASVNETVVQVMATSPIYLSFLSQRVQEDIDHTIVGERRGVPQPQAHLTTQLDASDEMDTQKNCFIGVKCTHWHIIAAHMLTRDSIKNGCLVLQQLSCPGHVD